jgi:hypothetical protein
MEHIASWFEAITQWSLWGHLTSIVNSNFTSALAGALAGALVAHRIADRANQRESLLKELRRTNAAIMLCFSIVNAGLALKRQFVASVYADYKAQAAALEAFKSRRAAGLIPKDEAFNFQADLRTLQMPLLPIDLLRTQVIDGISLAGRPLTAAMSLAGAQGHDCK